MTSEISSFFFIVGALEVVILAGYSSEMARLSLAMNAL